MALELTDWKAPISYVHAAADAKGLITAVYDLINANTLTHVTITDYSATEAHLELSVDGQPNARILLFGGQVPNTAALQGTTTPSANYVYILCSPDAATTGPDQSYTVGNPYNTSGGVNTLGVIAGSYATQYTLARLFECSDGVGIFYSNPSTDAFIGGAAGGLLQSPDKNTLRYLALGGGTGPISGTWASSTTGGAALIQPESSPATTDTRCSCIIEGYGSAIDAYRVERILSANNLKDTDGKGLLVPVVMASDSGNVSPGILRGLYMGPRATFGSTVASTLGWAMAGAAETDALYFANI